MCVPRPRRPMCHRASAGPGACMVPLERRRSVMKPLRACNRYNCDTLAFVVSSGLRGVKEVKEWKRGDISLKLTPANSPAPPPRRRLYLNALRPLWFPVGLEFRDVPSLVGGDDLPPQSIASASSPFRSIFTVIWLKYIVNSFPPPRTSTELVYTGIASFPFTENRVSPICGFPWSCPPRLTGRARRPGSPSCTAHAAPDVSCRSAARRDVEGPRSFDRLPHGRTDWRQPIACRCGR
jgi:hypothetical protein